MSENKFFIQVFDLYNATVVAKAAAVAFTSTLSVPIPVCFTAYLYWKGGKATSPPEESEKGNPGPEGNRTPRTDALHQEWSLRMGLVMREVRCKSFGRRNQKIKMYEPVYIPSPEREHGLHNLKH